MYSADCLLLNVIEMSMSAVRMCAPSLDILVWIYSFYQSKPKIVFKFGFGINHNFTLYTIHSHTYMYVCACSCFFFCFRRFFFIIIIIIILFCSCSASLFCRNQDDLSNNYEQRLDIYNPFSFYMFYSNPFISSFIVNTLNVCVCVCSVIVVVL